MKILSLFDGMSVGYQALKKVWCKVDKYYASEIDKYAIKIAKKNHPDIIHIWDVSKIKWEDYKDMDIIIGWSPCQNLSFAWKRKWLITKENIEILSLSQYLKLKEEWFEFQWQSYLFWEYIRLLNEIKPKYFLLENVRMSKKWKDVFSDTIWFNPVLINSSLFTAQNRERLYWVWELQEDWTYKQVNISQPKDKWVLFKNIYSKWTENNVTDKYISYAKTAIFRSDRPVELPRDKANTLLAWSRKLYKYNNIYRKFTAEEMEILQWLSVWYTEWVSNAQRYRMLWNWWTSPVIEFIFNEII